jgi:hypothetical protein
MNDLKDTLLHDIRSGKIAMTPRAYFTLKVAALVGIAAAIVVITVFICTFLFFTLRINGDETLLGFGSHGIRAFVRFFPWHLLLIDIALITLLQRLVRHFRAGYTVPVLYLVGGLFVGAIVLGFALDRGTPFNDRLHEGRNHLPPPIGRFYEGAERAYAHGGRICRCSILAIQDNTLTVQDTRTATSSLTIKLPNDSPYATTTGLLIGDIVFIAGEEEDGAIEAFGIRKESEGAFPHPK